MTQSTPLKTAVPERNGARSMILENSPESVEEALEVLGLPADTKIGMRKRSWYGEMFWEPVIETKTRSWYVGEEILPE